MKRLEFHISYICSHNCIFCSEYERMDKFKIYPLSFSEIKIILIDRKKKGFNHINFTGGEPTIIPGFLDLLLFTKNLGYKIYIGTNGTMFSSEKFTQEALKYIDELSLSVHWYSEETCEKQVGLKYHYRNFQKIVVNIEKYKKNNNLFFLNIVINKYNYFDIENIIRFVMEQGYSFKQVLVSILAPEGRAEINYKKLVFNLEEFKLYIPKIVKLCNEKQKVLRFFGLPLCILGDNLVDYSNDSHWEKRNTIERLKTKDGKIILKDVYSFNNSRARCFVGKCEGCKWKMRPCTGVFYKYLDYYKF
ncbi:radical SAM protein [Candidatus Gracilibacteria bacterium]|nr:radical SAM protein [Candidatus Gracilibacteria bacterium]NUJ98863.1 radical SAM protein [Candidatus Gracilibacteria bacterium]